MTALEHYLTQLVALRGSTVPETSYYALLQGLLDAVGDGLKPRVRAVIHPRNVGAGIPDLALFDERQPADQMPARGVVEVKPVEDDLLATARGEQVARYIRRYGQVLVTNYYQFILVMRGPDGSPVLEERYDLADSAQAFWAAALHPRALAEQHAGPLFEYLMRVMRRTAPLTTPQEVAWILASYAREARARMSATNENLRALARIRQQFEAALGLRFETETADEFFQSTLVQTLFYGVFSAWVLWHERAPASGATFDLWRDTRRLNVPVVQELFEEFSDGSRLPLAVEQVLEWTAAALNRVDRAAFFEQMGYSAPLPTGEGGTTWSGSSNAIQYFYEPFLEAFDPELRRQLGVWYTPPEVVEYMVARVDAALRDELGIVDGLADPNVYILDPCCGTGAYLVAVMRRIYTRLLERDGAVLAAQATRAAVQQRVFGFEILPAPFVVAHLQLGLVLGQLRAPLAQGERAGVYLTNALTGWEEKSQKPLDFPQLQQERDAAETIKQQRPILVVLGNPPYSGFAGVAVEEERDLTNAYRATRRAPAPQGQGLNDLYVRFYRMAERRIVEGTGQGIVCFISNYSWLDGLSHPGMRERYLDVFNKVYIDNLHGDRIISEYAPDGRTSETIFAIRGNSPGIRIGTAIATMIRVPNDTNGEGRATLYYQDWHQARAEERRQALLESVVGEGPPDGYTILQPAVEIGLPFKPRKVSEAYLAWPRLPELFPTSFPGVKTSRDDVLVDVDRERLDARMRQYFDPAITHEQLAAIAPGFMADSSGYNARAIRDTLLARGYLPGNIVRYCYRPFDLRWLYWEPETKLLDRNRAEYFPHVQPGNVWVESRQRQPMDAFDRGMVTRVLADNLGNGLSSYFPLYLYDTPKAQPGLFDDEPAAGGRKPNLSDAAAAYLDRLGLAPDAGAELLFYHALAVMHAPSYRVDNAGALRQDWPRIPLPAAPDALAASADLGRQVAALLDAETPVPGVTTGAPRHDLAAVAVVTTVDNAAPDFSVSAGWGHFGAGSAVMPGRGRVVESESGYDIYLNDTTYWRNVPEAVWEYTLGGYQVLKKWLSYRETAVLGRPLKAEEAREFMHIARRIAALLDLAPALDASYHAVAASEEARG